MRVGRGGVAETVNFDQIKRDYHVMHGSINPSDIEPAGPLIDVGEPHGREA